MKATTGSHANATDRRAGRIGLGVEIGKSIPGWRRVVNPGLALATGEDGHVLQREIPVNVSSYIRGGGFRGAADELSDVPIGDISLHPCRAPRSHGAWMETVCSGCGSY